MTTDCRTFRPLGLCQLHSNCTATDHSEQAVDGKIVCSWWRPTWPKCPAISCHWSIDWFCYVFAHQDFPPTSIYHSQELPSNMHWQHECLNWPRTRVNGCVQRSGAVGLTCEILWSTSDEEPDHREQAVDRHGHDVHLLSRQGGSHRGARGKAEKEGRQCKEGSPGSVSANHYWYCVGEYRLLFLRVTSKCITRVRHLTV